MGPYGTCTYLPKGEAQYKRRAQREDARARGSGERCERDGDSRDEGKNRSREGVAGKTQR